MNPDLLKLLNSALLLVKQIGVTPIWVTLALLVIGPWVSMTFISLRLSAENKRVSKSLTDQNAEVAKLLAENNQRTNESLLEFKEIVGTAISGQEKRFEEVVHMYENNVKMVNDYHNLADDLTGIITLTTRTLEGLVQKIDNNMFCPVIREKGPRG